MYTCIQYMGNLLHTHTWRQNSRLAFITCSFINANIFDKFAEIHSNCFLKAVNIKYNKYKTNRTIKLIKTF